MKKLLLLGLVLGSFFSVRAQVVPDSAEIIDVAEDTTQLTTINDIIAIQERVNTRNATDMHFSEVWSRKSFFNIGLVWSNVKSKDKVALSNSTSKMLEFKHDYGVRVELGHNYALHRKPIANMLQFNLDLTFLDLTFNHYSKDAAFESYVATDRWKSKPGNAAASSQYNDNGFAYLPWGAEKYDLTYGMSIGPSLTIAPFMHMNSTGLHYIKLNAYWHFGYNASILLMNESDNRSEGSGSESKSKGLHFDYLTYGLGTSLRTFGFNLTWKMIGLGWETRTANLEYKPLSTEDYGDFKTKLKNTSSFVYLSIRY